MRIDFDGTESFPSLFYKADDTAFISQGHVVLRILEKFFFALNPWFENFTFAQGASTISITLYSLKNKSEANIARY